MYMGFISCLAGLVIMFPVKRTGVVNCIRSLILMFWSLVLILIYPSAATGLKLISGILALFFSTLPLSFKRYVSSHLVFIMEERPWILYVNMFLNWDQYSWNLLKVTKVICGKSENLSIDENLRNDYQWLSDILNLLYVLGYKEEARDLLNRSSVDLTKPGIPADYITTLNKLYSGFGEIDISWALLDYLEAHYNDMQHFSLKIYNYMIFFAQSGCEKNFYRLTEEYPRILNKKVLFPWEVVLNCRKGNREKVLEILENSPSSGNERDRKSRERINQLARETRESDLPPVILAQVEQVFPTAPPFKPVEKKAKKSLATLILSLSIAAISLIPLFLSGIGKLSDIFTFQSVDVLSFLRSGAYADPLVQSGEWVRLLSSIFLHGDLIHLALNLYCIYIVGRLLERIFGSVYTLFIFFAGGLLGNLFSLFWGNYLLSVGASGGGFALLAALLVYLLTYRKQMHKESFNKTMVMFGILIIVQIYYGLSEENRVNNLAHLGGFLGGVLTALLYFIVKKYRSSGLVLLNRVCQGVLITMGIFLLVNWPPLFTRNYYDALSFNTEKELNGLLVTVPSTWVEVREMLYDLYFDCHMIVYKPEYKPSLTGEGGIKSLSDFLKNEENLILGTIYNGKVLSRGWMDETLWYEIVFKEGYKESEKELFRSRYYRISKGFVSRIDVVEMTRSPEKTRYIQRIIKSIKDTENRE